MSIFSKELPPTLSVALDVSAVPPKPAGAGRYIAELACQLAKRDDLSLTLVTTKSGTARWSELAHQSRLVSCVPNERPLRLAYERIALARVLDRLQSPPIDVVHSPHYTMPAAVRGARVVTVHDVTFLEHPEWHERSKVPIFRDAIKRAARSADVVVCVSPATARRLRSLVEVRCEIAVAEHGVDHARFCPGEVDRSVLPSGLVEGRLVVHCGTLEPRKGGVDLIGAFSLLASRYPDIHLVLAGQPGWGVTEIDQAVKRSLFPDRIHRLGFVEDSTLICLLRAASAVVYPSRDEGFGMPALEALAVGAPLLTTEGTSMAEFSGEAAWLSPPGDVERLAATLAQLLETSPEERERRRQIGLGVAAGFTWERTATRHLEAYQEAAQRARARL